MIIKDGQIVLAALLKTGKKKCLKFVPNKDLQQLAQQLNLLGSICIKDKESEEGSAEVREYTAKLQGKYKVNGIDCMVTYVYIYDDTTLFSTMYDNKNQYLKRLNITDFKAVDQLQLEHYSYSVCRTGSQEVAVAVYGKKTIQFVSVAGTMTLTRSFSTERACWGMAFNEITGEFFVSNDGNQVKVYDKTGNVLQSYANDDKGKPLLSQSRYITWSADPTTLFITGWKNGLIALDKSSYLRWTFCDYELRNAQCVCVLPVDVFLMSGYDSHNVIQVVKHGKKIGILIGAGDNLINPITLAYHHDTSRLIVVQKSNETYIYTLSFK